MGSHLEFAGEVGDEGESPLSSVADQRLLILMPLEVTKLKTVAAVVVVVVVVGAPIQCRLFCVKRTSLD